jgi:hypothetical protein
LKSGSKRKKGNPPELSNWQVEAIEAVATSTLGNEVVFGGGAALAAL